MPPSERIELAATICNAVGGALITIASTLKQQARNQQKADAADVASAVVTKINAKSGGDRL